MNTDLDIQKIFPHTVAEVQLDVDVEAIANDCRKYATEDQQTGWDCDVISTFKEGGPNYEFAFKHYDFLNQVEQRVHEFVRLNGWETDGMPDYMTQWWINRYTGNHWQEFHHHGKHKVCAIFYATWDAVPTRFLNPNEYTFQIGVELEGRAKYFDSYPHPGKLLIFPGYMFHQVPYKTRTPITYEQDRITIAFNFTQVPNRPLDMFEGGENAKKMLTNE